MSILPHEGGAAADLDCYDPRMRLQAPIQTLVVVVTALLCGATPFLASGARAQEASAAQQKANLLDPQGDFWAPRRGPRTELAVFVGPEGSLAELGGTEGLPRPTGVNFTLTGRHYPVGRLAITGQVRNFFGFGNAAAGTGAATVISPMLGVRWDLVREGRFSFLIDVYSGPAFFAFADFAGALDSLTAKWALGLEFGIALTLRYSLGPLTFEVRPNAGLRAGSAKDIGRPSGDVGPFSALYAGVDAGVTWSFWEWKDAP